MVYGGTSESKELGLHPLFEGPSVGKGALSGCLVRLQAYDDFIFKPGTFLPPPFCNFQRLHDQKCLYPKANKPAAKTRGIFSDSCITMNYVLLKCLFCSTSRPLGIPKTARGG